MTPRAEGEVAVEGLGFTYPDGTRALRDVTFTIAPGACVALIGANGAGKSTLLLHLNGSASPDHGTVHIGALGVGPATLEAVRRSVGMVFQDPDDQLFMPSVQEDVAFGPRNLGLPEPEVSRRVVEALMAGLAGADVCVARWEGRLQPIFAAYRRSLAELCEAQLAAGELRPVRLYDRVRTRILEAGEITALDPEGLSMLDVNDPEAYRHALDLLARMGGGE